MKKIFLCHTSKNKSFVRKLSHDLQKNGIDVWLDEKEILVGDSILEKIEKALENVNFVAVVLSPEALKRPWVLKELRAAMALEIQSRSKVILPVLLKPVKMPIFLRDKHYANFTISYSEGLQNLLTAIEPARVGLQKRLETIRSEILLDIIRLDGSIAKYTKKVLHRCKEGHVDSVVENLFADGKIKDVYVEPGEIVAQWNESGINHIRTLLPKSLHPGANIDLLISCKFLDCVIDDENYFQIKQDYPTNKLKLNVRFPKGRPPTSWEAYERRGPDKHDVSHMLSMTKEHRKPVLEFIINKPRLQSTYIVLWNW